MSSSDDEGVEESGRTVVRRPLPPEMEDISTHPLFWEMIPENADDNPEFRAIQEMVYGETTPSERAENWKTQGNGKLKVYLEKGKNLFYVREAVDLYSKAIAEPGWEDDKLRAVLHSNRAQAHVYLNNWRSALNDAKRAMALDPSHVKAYVRGARAALELREFEECQSICDRGARVENAAEFRRIREQAAAQARKTEEARRRAEREREEARAPARELARAVVSRGFRVGPPQFAIGDRQPQRLEDGTLAWPVLLLYPEVGAQEAIEAARESDPFSAHLEVMFGPGVPPPAWDSAGRYTLDKVEAYYMANAAQPLGEEQLATALQGSWPGGREWDPVRRYGPQAVRPVLVDPRKPLGDVLREEGHVIPGIPVFFVLARGTEYRDKFLESV